MNQSPKQRLAKLLREMTEATVQDNPWPEQLQSIEFRLALLVALHLDEDTEGIGRVIAGLTILRDYFDERGPLNPRGLN
jgi:hypothetical protein